MAEKELIVIQGEDSAVRIREEKVQTFLSKIEASWRKTLESIFAVGDLINEAREKLSRPEFVELKNRLSFGVRTAERLAAIASDKRLRQAKLQKMLPACWTTSARTIPRRCRWIALRSASL